MEYVRLCGEKERERSGLINTLVKLLFAANPVPLLVIRKRRRRTKKERKIEWRTHSTDCYYKRRDVCIVDGGVRPFLFIHSLRRKCMPPLQFSISAVTHVLFILPEFPDREKVKPAGNSRMIFLPTYLPCSSLYLTHTHSNSLSSRKSIIS